MWLDDWKAERANAADERRLRAGGTVAYRRATAAKVRADVQDRGAKAQSTKTESRKTYTEQQRRWDSVDTPVAERPTLRPEADLAVPFRVGGAAAACLDALLAAWLMAFFTTLPTGWAAAIGILAALCLTLIAESAATAIVAHGLQTPRVALDRLLLAVTMLLIADALLLLVMLLARSGVQWAVPAFGVLSAVAALVSPALSGFLLAAARMVNWSRRCVARYERAEAQERLLASLMRACDSADNLRTRSDEKGSRSGCGAAVVAILLAGVAAAPARAQRADVLVDRSGSSVRQMVGAVTKTIAAGAPAMSARLGITQWTVTPFTNDALLAVAESVPWPRSKRVPCGAVIHSEPGGIFAQVYRKENDSAQLACAQRQAVQTSADSVAQSDAVRRLSVALDRPAAHPGACTSITDLLQRLSDTQSGNLALAVTDGVESCSSGLDKVAQPAGRAILVLVSSNSDRQLGRDLARRRSVLHGAAPWLKVVFPYQLVQTLADVTAARP
ncbi:MAG: hypothetical protein M3081_15255 [Gemmatimonadota bacterium]|nr:hypothetical protein [Gemmatimonadota bacterium]